MENSITVSGLTKVFKVAQKNKEGFLASVKSLVKRDYKMITAVDNISFIVKKGEIRGLIGPNGAGKSTTIKMLSGILYPTGGTVNVLGYVPWKEREQYLRKIGVLLGQKSQLVWDLPPLDSFILNKEIYKIPEEKYKKNLDYFVEILSLSDVIKRPVRQLSLGERMKCELVSSMLHDPELVFLDEPTIGMDVVAKDVIRKFIKKINQERGVTFILTTHDISDIENLCHNITIINHGSIAYNDTIENLRTFFKDRRIVEVKFSAGLTSDDFKGFKVQSFDQCSAKIEVDLSESNIQNEIAKIFASLPVNDITIENIQIEEVIRQLYEIKFPAERQALQTQPG